MKEILKYWMEKTVYFQPKISGNIAIMPFLHDSNTKIHYISGGKAMSQNLVNLREISHGGSVGEIIIENLSPEKIFFPDGDQIIGAKQNRILNHAILVDALSNVKIDVSCVEQGRWQYQSQKFNRSNHMAPMDLRKAMKIHVENYLLKEQKFKSNQSEVWEKVHKTIRDENFYSPTMAMNEALDQIYLRKKELIEAFKFNRKFNGFVAFVDDKIINLEYISSPDCFQDYYEKFISSLLMDMEVILNKKGEIDYPGKLNEFILKINNSESMQFKSTALGEDIRWTIDDYKVSCLSVEDEIINLSVH